MTDMREFVARYLGEPAKTGPKWWTWHCQINQPDRRPSLKVEANGFKCFSCGAWGSRQSKMVPEVAFLHDEFGYSWKTAWADVEAEQFPTRYRREHAPCIEIGLLPPREQWRQVFFEALARCQVELWFGYREGSIGRRLVARRGLSMRTCEHFGVGYNCSWLRVEEYDTWLAEGLVFPAYVEGKLWSLEVRVTSETGPKYHRPKGGSEPTPFGIDTLSDKDVLVITEGAIDALVAWQVCGGEIDVLGLRGASNTLRAWEGYLCYPRVIVCTDADEAGDAIADKLLLCYPTWERRRPPEGLDLGDMLKSNQLVKGWLLGEEATL